MYNFSNEELKTMLFAISTYGRTLQSIIAMEELSELQKEISKAARKVALEETEIDIAYMQEEVADVLIMIRQLIMMYCLDENEIATTIAKKIIRLDERMKKDLEKKRYDGPF